MKPDVLLFSGGIESTCLAYLLRPKRLLFIDYGQIPAIGEANSCQSISDILGLSFEKLSIPSRNLGSGVMADGFNHSRSTDEHWPFRNQLLITIAAMYLKRNGLTSLVFGSVLGDSKFTDGTHKFQLLMTRTLRSQDKNIHLFFPARKLSSIGLVRKSKIAVSVLLKTFSCHISTDTQGCGFCTGCLKRQSIIEQVCRL